jgi:hypothetical protein
MYGLPAFTQVRGEKRRLWPRDTDKVVPNGNKHFTGRKDCLARLRQDLRCRRHRTASVASAGKTEIAVECVHCFRVTHDIVW